MYLQDVPRDHRLPQNHLLNLQVDYSANISPLTEAERRQRLISGQSLIEGPNEQPMGSGVVTSSLPMCPAEWVAAAMGTLRAESPDLDFRPGSIVRTLLETAANQLPLAPQEVTLDRLRRDAVPLLANGFAQDLQRYMEAPRTTGRNRNPYRVPDAQTARLAEQIRTAEDEEVFRRLDEIGRMGVFQQEHMGTPMPMPIRTELEVLAADPPREPLGFTVREEVGTAVINPRAIDRIQGRRVQMPMFEIAANPTIRLGDIRSRRFGLGDRNPDHPFILALIRSQQNQIPSRRVPPNPPVESTGIRRTVWEVILEG